MSYTVNGREYDDWSVKNQRILDSLIDREVYCCMTSEVEYMLSKAQYEEDDDNNPFSMNDYDKTFSPCCDKCNSSYGFDEITVKEMKDEEFESDTELNYDTDELEDGYLCPACGIWHKSIKEARDCCDNDEIVYRCRDCGKIYSEDDYQRLDYKPQEIYEWWAVSVWFGEKLEEQGCTVVESYGKSYWGRCTTGQSISLDGCVINIAKNMNILDGMENDWGDR